MLDHYRGVGETCIRDARRQGMPVPVASPPRALDVVLVSAIALVVVGPVAYAITRRRFDPFEPIVVFALAYGAMFVLRPAAMIGSGDLVHLTPLRAVDVSDTFTEMLSLGLLGAVAFVLGYIAPIGRRLARARNPCDDRLDEKRAVVASVFFALLGVAAFGAFLAWSGGLATFTLMFKGGSRELGESVASFPAYFWHAFLVLIPAALVIFALARQSRKGALFALFLSLAAIILLRAFAFGERMMLVAFLGGLFVLYYVSRSRRPGLPLLLGLAIVALLASTLLRELRGREARGETVVESLTTVTQPRRVFDPIVHGTDTEMAPAFAAALKVIPEDLSRRYGGAIVSDLVVRPIPRALWDEKPLAPREELISHLWPAEYERLRLNTEFSALLFFYWDFGIPGIVLGLALYGLGARLLYEYFLVNRRNGFATVLFSVSVWLVVIGVRGSPVDTLVWGLFMVAPVVVIARLAARRAAGFIQDSVAPEHTRARPAP